MWVAHAPGIPGTFSTPLRASNPVMHHGMCVTHVPWCMPGSLTSGFPFGGRENVSGIAFMFVQNHSNWLCHSNEEEWYRLQIFVYVCSNDQHTRSGLMESVVYSSELLFVYKLYLCDTCPFRRTIPYYQTDEWCRTKCHSAPERTYPLFSDTSASMISIMRGEVLVVSHRECINIKTIIVTDYLFWNAQQSTFPKSMHDKHCTCNRAYQLNGA